MKYEKPDVQILVLEAEDIVTSSDGLQIGEDEDIRQWPTSK